MKCDAKFAIMAVFLWLLPWQSLSAVNGARVLDDGFQKHDWQEPLYTETEYSLLPSRYWTDPSFLASTGFPRTDTLRVQFLDSRNHFFLASWDDGRGWFYRTEIRLIQNPLPVVDSKASISVPAALQKNRPAFQPGDTLTAKVFRCYRKPNLFTEHWLVKAGTLVQVGRQKENGFIEIHPEGAENGWVYHTELHPLKGDE